MEKNLTPKIRFRGFTEPWKELPLKENVTYSSGKGYTKNDLKSDGNQIILYGRLYTQHELEIDTVDTFADIIENAKVSEGGEVIMPSSGETAEDIAVASVVNNPGIILGGGLHVLTPKQESITSSFLANTICYGDLHKQIAKLAQGKSVVHIYQQNILEQNVIAPSVDEQKTINNYFRHVEQSISAMCDELEKLENLKKACMERMFPREGETTPKIRFKGFTDDWKEVLFGDIVSIKRGLTYSPNDLSDSNNGILVLRSSNIDEDVFVLNDDDVYVSESAINIEFAKDNDILITSANGSTRLVGKHALVSIGEKKCVHGGFMLLATADMPFFTNALMGTNWYRGFINKFVAGGNGAIGNLNKNDLDTYPVLIPSLAEQEKIGNYFHHLDELIAAKRQEIEKLKDIKQSLLDKMFV